MRIIGLTGNIAAGKSAVAARLRTLGAWIIDADQLAREAVAPGSPGLAAIRARWGPAVLLPDGSLDRAALRGIVFRDPTERAALDAIVHPAVKDLRERELARAAAAGATLVIADIPLLYETGLEDSVDLVVLVDAPVAVRQQRLVRDRQLAPDEADAMIAAQMPSEDKRRRADVILDNIGSLKELQAQVDALWARLREPPPASVAARDA